MIKSNASYENYAVGERQVGGDPLSVGPALLAAFGLSLLGWSLVLVPLVAIFHQ